MSIVTDPGHNRVILTDDDGKLLLKLDLGTCQNEAAALCSAFRDTFHSVGLDVLHQEIERYRATFDGESFWQTGYRHWFHGKDVLKHWLNKYRNVGHDAYCAWVASNFTQLWVDWRQQFPDLADIQRICQT